MATHAVRESAQWVAITDHYLNAFRHILRGSDAKAEAKELPRDGSVPAAPPPSAPSPAAVRVSSVTTMNAHIFFPDEVGGPAVSPTTRAAPAVDALLAASLVAVSGDDEHEHGEREGKAPALASVSPLAAPASSLAAAASSALPRAVLRELLESRIKTATRYFPKGFDADLPTARQRRFFMGEDDWGGHIATLLPEDTQNGLGAMATSAWSFLRLAEVDRYLQSLFHMPFSTPEPDLYYLSRLCASPSPTWMAANLL